MVDLREGGCLCGAARYTVDVEGGNVGNCHCTTCRRHSGAPYQTFITVPDSKFKWLKKPLGYIQSGDISGRYFCKECGTPLLFVTEAEAGMTSLAVATIDDPSGVTVKYEIFTASRMDGVLPVAGSEQFEGYD